MTTAELYDIAGVIRSQKWDSLVGIAKYMAEKTGEFYELVSTHETNIEILKILLYVLKEKSFEYITEVYPYFDLKNKDIEKIAVNDVRRDEHLKRLKYVKPKNRCKREPESRNIYYTHWIRIIYHFYPDFRRCAFNCDIKSESDLKEIFPWLTSDKQMEIISRLKRIGEIPDMEEVVKSDKVVSPNDKKRGRKPDKFSDCIVGKYEKDTQRIIDLMREELANKKGKAAAEVIYAAMQLGYITKPTHAGFYSEFKTEVGGRLITANEYTRLVTKVDEADIMNYKIDEEMKRRLKI